MTYAATTQLIGVDVPHRAFLVTKLNDCFSHPLADDQKEIVANATSLVDTLYGLDLLGDLPKSDVIVIADSLGESVQAAILAALQSAAMRDLPVVFQWRPSRYGSVSLFEAADDDGVGMVGCTVEMPWLRDANSVSQS